MPINKLFEFDVDLNQPYGTQPIKLIQGDTNSDTFIMTIKENGLLQDLTGVTRVTLTMLKSDNTRVVGECSILDPIKGTVKYVVGTNDKAAVGTVTCSIQVYSTAGAVRTSSNNFKFTAVADLDNGTAVTSTTQYPILTTLIDTVNTAETTRTTNENTRIANEGDATKGRVKAENDRVTAEGLRGTAEANRVTAENTRVSNENTRISSESARVTAEGSRVTAEINRATAETTRQGNETSRVNAEDARSVCIPYDALHAFVVGNKTTYLGSTYRNKVGCTGIAPTEGVDSTNWLLVAKKGDTGPAGPGTGDMTISIYDTNSDGKVNSADTADKLSTSRNINGVPFDGTANITIVDSTKEPVIITKNTAFNKNYGATATDVKMNGTQTVGIVDEIARIDHVHPVDTSRAAASDLTTHLADDTSHIYYSVATGTNTYVITTTPAPTAYVDGMAVCVKFTNASTGASTLNWNGLGAQTILDSNGSAIASGTLKAGYPYTMRYSTTANSFILQAKGGGTATAGTILSPYTATVNTGQVTGTIPSKTTQTYTPGTSAQTIASGQYLSGTQTISGDINLVASNILTGKSIFGVAGSVIAGKRCATGRATSSSNVLTVTGLTFQPSIVICHGVSQGTFTDIGLMVVANAEGGSISTITMTAYGGSSSNASSDSVNASGFSMGVPLNASYDWVAIE